MPSPTRVKLQINELIDYLVRVGLADDQSYAFQKVVGGNLHQVTFQGSHHVLFALKNLDYDEIYLNLVHERAYNVKMLDGALIQMMYAISDGHVRHHRLAFFPAPHLENFQDDPEVYLEEVRDADVVARNIVRFPLRFDYDFRDGRQALAHPKSHLTLGQYENCRIPVTAPVAPFWFIDFILRNFYQTELRNYAEELPRQSCDFTPSIRPSEKAIIHVAVPL